MTKEKSGARTDIPKEVIQEAYGVTPTPTPAEEQAQETAATEEEMVSLPAADLAALQQQLQQTQNQSKEYFDGWQRERADFSNYKRRIERDQSQLSQVLTAEVLKKYLVILDDLERALKNRPVEGDAAVAWASGIELIQRKLANILEAEGVRRMQAENEQFDPTRHEAISQEENPNFLSGQIIEVLQQGYTLGDRILRPALVRVAL